MDKKIINQTMKYTILFSIFGKRMKVKITAKSRSEAESKIRTKVAEQVKFEVPEKPEISFEDLMNKLGVKL